MYTLLLAYTEKDSRKKKEKRFIELLSHYNRLQPNRGSSGCKGNSFQVLCWHSFFPRGAFFFKHPFYFILFLLFSFRHSFLLFLIHFFFFFFSTVRVELHNARKVLSRYSRAK